MSDGECTEVLRWTWCTGNFVCKFVLACLMEAYIVSSIPCCRQQSSLLLDCIETEMGNIILNDHCIAMLTLSLSLSSVKTTRSAVIKSTKTARQRIPSDRFCGPFLHRAVAALISFANDTVQIFRNTCEHIVTSCGLADFGALSSLQ